MTGVFAVPTTRTSDLLVSQRLLAQLQFNNQELLRIQQQVGSGRQFAVPSDDAPASQKASTLQQLLERKEQIKTNVDTGQSYLTATENVLASLSDVLNDIRGKAIGVSTTTATSQEREATAVEIERAMDHILQTGNSQYRGRYLFAGSQSTEKPFSSIGQYVRFSGNTNHLSSFLALDSLFPTNFHGDQVFGAISQEVVGTADLSPRLIEETRVSDLRGGLGIRPGSIEISDGINSSLVDITSAETVGDVADLIENNPPAGRTLTVTLSATGLNIAIDTAGGGNFSIDEVGGGTTASELGILRDVGMGTQPIIGTDVNPRLALTTRIHDILGTHASGILPSTGADNDILIEARQGSASFNGITARFVDDNALQAAPGLTVGNETAKFTTSALPARGSLALSGADNDLVITAATAGAAQNGVQIVLDASNNLGDNAVANYNSASKLLTIQIDDTNETSLNSLVSAINASGDFTAAGDSSAGESLNLASFVNSADAGVVSGITDGGADANTLLIHIRPGGTTANDVINAIQSSAETNDLFEVALVDLDTTNSANAGTAAVQAASTAVLSGGSGVAFDQQSGIQILNGGQTHTFTFEDAKTVEDLLNILNISDAGIVAEINDDQNGINIRSRLSGSDFSIGENGGATANQLGIRSLTSDVLLSRTNHELGIDVTTGTDFTIRRSDGVDLDIDISDAVTIGDVLDAINNHPANTDPTNRVEARLTEYGNGISLVEENPTGAGTLTVTQAFGSYAARQLGLPIDDSGQATAPQLATAATASIQLPPPNDANTAISLVAVTSGSGLDEVDVVFHHRLIGDVANATYDAANKQLVIDIDATQTTANTIVGAIIAEGTFTAALDTTVDPTNDGSGVFAATGSLASTSGGEAMSMTGTDPYPLETKGVFNTLFRLAESLRRTDYIEIERTIAMLDDDALRLNYARAELGTREQGLDVVRDRLLSEDVELRRALSSEIDVDLVKAISDLTNKQTALEASLRSIGQVFELSLLNFL